MGFLDFIFGNKKKKQERLRLEEEARLQKLEKERLVRERERQLQENRLKEYKKQEAVKVEKDRTVSMGMGSNKQPLEQRGETTKRKVITTGHLLMLKELLNDTFFAFKHETEQSDYPSFMWAEGNFYLGDESKINYSVPFLWIKNLAHNNVPKFNYVMNTLNNEYLFNDDLDPSSAVQSIVMNGFWNFKPQFNLNINQKHLNTFYKDSSCLFKIINVFGENVNPASLLPQSTDRVYIPFVSNQINEIINEMIADFRRGRLSFK